MTTASLARTHNGNGNGNGGQDAALAERPAPRPAPPTPGSLNWSAKQIKVLKDTIAKGTDDTQFALFANYCRESGLNPFTGEISCSVRDGKLTINFHVEGLAAIAESSGQFDGEEGPFYASRDDAERGVWREVWTDAESKPYVLKHIAYRRDRSKPVTAIIYFDEFERLGGFMWRGQKGIPLHMAGLRVRGHALRKGWRREVRRRELVAEEMGIAIAAESDAAALASEVEAAPQLVDAQTHTQPAEATESEPEAAQERAQAAPPAREFKEAVEAGEVPDPRKDDEITDVELRPTGDPKPPEDDYPSQAHRRYADTVKQARALRLKGVPMMADDAPDEFVDGERQKLEQRIAEARAAQPTQAPGSK